jgi:CheY-like chemotaxis protein
MQNTTLPSPRAHILLVARNRGALELLESMLSWRGYRVTTAVDGRDGLEKFQDGHFQLILTNLSTPSISGWELGRIVKKSESSIPVALVTDIDFGDRPDHSPFDAIIPEPIPFDDLEYVVDSLIDCQNGGARKASTLECLCLGEGSS